LFTKLNKFFITHDLGNLSGFAESSQKLRVGSTAIYNLMEFRDLFEDIHQITEE
jgi:hypothetical protein